MTFDGKPAPQAGAQRRRAYLHIGAPKTGTTFLQQVLWKNRRALSHAGVLYPYGYSNEHFHAMLDVRRLRWGGTAPDRFAGVWSTVAERVREWDGGTALLTNEVLAGASPSTIERIVETLEPYDVHVVFTARDFARQLVSDWQEHIKHKHTPTLEDFVADLREFGLHAPAPFGEMFWGLHDAAQVLSRWASVIPPERIHLITVPTTGGPVDTLWHRFCQVTELDSAAYTLPTDRANRSVGMVEAELLRRINKHVKTLDDQAYDRFVRVELAQLLAGRSAIPVLPTVHHEWVLERSHELVAALEPQGFDVVGDLKELIPDLTRHADYVPTAELSAGTMLSSSVIAISALLEDAAEQQGTIRELRERLQRAGLDDR
ncbi:MAG TPA: hypothetical protein VHG70_13060 [Nocardioidaceae bacterium]|nr:hypothetical protein [Nocardioidaceae bacterium]